MAPAPALPAPPKFFLDITRGRGGLMAALSQHRERA